MKRLGFADDEIYDTLAGMGLPGEQVQLLIDRVSAEFHEAGIEPQTSRLASEVRKVFTEGLEETRMALNSRMDSHSRELQSIGVEIEKLGNRIKELLSVVGKLQMRVKSNRRQC